MYPDEAMSLSDNFDQQPQDQTENKSEEDYELKEFKDCFKEKRNRHKEQRIRIKMLRLQLNDTDVETEKDIMQEKHQKRLRHCLFRKIAHRTLAKSKSAQKEYIKRWQNEQFNKIRNDHVNFNTM